MSSKLFLAVPPILLIAACNSVNPVTGSPDPAFGEAVKYDTAIQTINPEPVYAQGSAQPGANGEVGQKAVERYRTDKAKPVQTQQTSMSTAASGSGSSGSGH